MWRMINSGNDLGILKDIIESLFSERLMKGTEPLIGGLPHSPITLAKCVTIKLARLSLTVGGNPGRGYIDAQSRPGWMCH
jgi:hypothetical protein